MELDQQHISASYGGVATFWDIEVDQQLDQQHHNQMLSPHKVRKSDAECLVSVKCVSGKAAKDEVK